MKLLLLLLLSTQLMNSVSQLLIHLRLNHLLESIYLVGIPLDFNGGQIVDALIGHGIPNTQTCEQISLLDVFGFKNKYVLLRYADDSE